MDLWVWPFWSASQEVRKEVKHIIARLAIGCSICCLPCLYGCSGVDRGYGNVLENEVADRNAARREVGWRRVEPPEVCGKVALRCLAIWIDVEGIGQDEALSRLRKQFGNSGCWFTICEPRELMVEWLGSPADLLWGSPTWVAKF